MPWIQMHVTIIWYGLTSSQQKESATIVIIVMVGFSQAHSNFDTFNDLHHLVFNLLEATL